MKCHQQRSLTSARQSSTSFMEVRRSRSSTSYLSSRQRHHLSGLPLPGPSSFRCAALGASQPALTRTYCAVAVASPRLLPLRSRLSQESQDENERGQLGDWGHPPARKLSCLIKRLKKKCSGNDQAVLLCENGKNGVCARMVEKSDFGSSRRTPRPPGSVIQCVSDDRSISS